MGWQPTSPFTKKKPVVTSPYVTAGNRAPTPPKTTTPTNLYNPVANQNKPGTSPAIDYLYENFSGFGNTPGYLRGRMANELWQADTATGGYPSLSGLTPMGPGGGGRGGGGGGGAAAPTGLDQATLDWLFGQMGMGKPQGLTYNPLDLPDPSQYFGKFDTSQYDVARQGVTSGIQGIRERGNQAFDAAQTELNQYQNPYGTGLQAHNPDQYAAMERMAQANNATGALADVAGQGVQADQAFGNVQALMAANDQARQAANLRALGGDRRMMDTNLGLEGNLLNLGVNMGQAKGQSAWDQMLKQLGFDTASQEAAQNWQRGNTVGDTNVTNRNQYNQGLMQTLLSIIGAKAPGTTLPTDTGGWYATA
jgi:hypothetical protein